MNNKQNMKAYKSLKAYNFCVYRQVQDVYFNIVKENVQFCFVKLKGGKIMNYFFFRFSMRKITLYIDKF